MILYGQKNYSYPVFAPPFSQTIINVPPYLKINNTFIYPGENNNLTSLSFTSNKRGGDTSKITFSKLEIPISVGDTIQLFINNKSIYQGYIEQYKITKNIEYTIVPEWAKLNNLIISGGIVIEATLPIREVVFSLKNFITKMNIGFIPNKINLPSDVFITIATMGKTIAEILDECEKELPPGYNWSVQNGIFNFAPIQETTSGLLNWYNTEFSESEFEEDFADIFTETSVWMKTKDAEGNSYDRSVGVVGEKPPYPPIEIKKLLGVKQNKLQFPYTLADEDALNIAYNLLLNQFIPSKIAIKNLNYEKKLPKILFNYKVYGKPKSSLCIRFTRSGGGNSIGSNLPYTGGQIFNVGSRVGTSIKLDNPFNFNFKNNRVYQEYCNVSGIIENVFINYKSINNISNFTITDGINVIPIIGNSNKATINLSSLNILKRDLSIICTDLEDDSFSFIDIFITFKDCSEINSGSLRKIVFTMDSNFIFKANIDIAPIGMVLNGYLWSEQQKIKQLEAILNLEGA